MNYLKITNTIKENILLSKIDIKSMPLIDSEKSKHIEEIQGNHLRAMKSAPLVYDLMLNIIDRLKITNKLEYIEDKDKDYYSIELPAEGFFREYTQKADNYTIRQSLYRQIISTTVPYTKVRYENGYMELRPFNILFDFEDEGNRTVTIKFSKLVFKSLIENENKDGFVYIPKLLFPISTIADLNSNTNIFNGQKVIASHNPFYKLNIYAISKNTHKKGSIEVNKQEFFQKVIPELITKKQIDKFNLKYSEGLINNSLKKGIGEIKSKIENALIVKSLYLGNRETTTIYFDNYKK